MHVRTFKEDEVPTSEDIRKINLEGPELARIIRWKLKHKEWFAPDEEVETIEMLCKRLDKMNLKSDGVLEVSKFVQEMQRRLFN